MPIDLKRLKKLESVPARTQAEPPAEGEKMVVLVKLRKGASRPDYVSPRAHISPDMFSAEIEATDLERLEADPGVESMSLSKKLPGIE